MANKAILTQPSPIPSSISITVYRTPTASGKGHYYKPLAEHLPDGRLVQPYIGAITGFNGAVLGNPETLLVTISLPVVG